MELIEITNEEYRVIIGENIPVFCTYDFLELNKDKVQKIRYLLGKDKKNRLVVAFGEKERTWKAPFSAPFSTIIALQQDLSLEYYWEFVDLFTKYAISQEILEIEIILPPDVYNRESNARIISALLGSGYGIVHQDVNFSLDVKKINIENYLLSIHYNARKNLKISLKSDLTLFRCNDDESKKEAYEVIRLNRMSKGYPLRMSMLQVMQTIKFVENDFFLVKKDGKSIAAAIIFYVDKKNVQVIYWGDIPEVSEYKPINFLAYELIKYYKEKGISGIDIGPSSENGVASFGLCNFKESIGCDISSKFKLSKRLI